MAWACPIQANDDVGEEKFFYAGGWPTKGKYAEEDTDEALVDL